MTSSCRYETTCCHPRRRRATSPLPVVLLLGFVRVSQQQGATLGDKTTGDYLKCMQVAVMLRDRNKFQNELGENVIGMTRQSCMDCEPNPAQELPWGGGTRNPPPPHLDWKSDLVDSCPDGCQELIDHFYWACETEKLHYCEYCCSAFHNCNHLLCPHAFVICSGLFRS